jgi:hypothetical protein
LELERKYAGQADVLFRLSRPGNTLRRQDKRLFRKVNLRCLAKLHDPKWIVGPGTFFGGSR